MAECAGLENQCTFTGTKGSNPSLSAFAADGEFVPYSEFAEDGEVVHDDEVAPRIACFCGQEQQDPPS